MNNDNPWTFEEEQVLIDMRYEGKSYEEIIKVLGGTSNSLRKKHHRLMKEAYTPQWWKRIEEFEMGNTQV